MLLLLIFIIGCPTLFLLSFPVSFIDWLPSLLLAVVKLVPKMSVGKKKKKRYLPVAQETLPTSFLHLVFLLILLLYYSWNFKKEQERILIS
jgi:hypothetical protein